MPFRLSIRIPARRKLFSLLVCTFVLSTVSVAQSLTGLWTGALHNDSTTVRRDQSFEIALTEYKGKVYGYSRSEFVVDDTVYYVVKRVKGTIEGDICEVVDDEIIAYNFRGKLDKGVRVTSTFRRNQADSTWYLDGTWKTNATKKYYSVSGKVNLANEKDLTASKLFPHLEELSLANDVAFYKERVQTPSVVRVVRPEGQATSRIQASAGTMPVAAATPANSESIPASLLMPSVKGSEQGNDKTTTAHISGNTVAVQPSAQPAAADITPAHLLMPSVKTVEDDNARTTSTTIKPTATQVKAAVPEATPVALTTSVSRAETVAASAGQQKPVVGGTTAGVNKPELHQSKASVPDAAAMAKTTAVADTPPEYISIDEAPVNRTNKVQPVAVQKNNSAPVITATANNKASLPVAKPAADIREKAKVIAGRTSVFSQEVNFKSDSLVIALYDNGEIDGDTVSVFMNGEALLRNQGLRSNAIKKTIYLTPGQEEFTLVMFAESLGKYPPNTGLLVIRDGEDVYNLRFSSDFQNSTGIVFRRKQP